MVFQAVPTIFPEHTAAHECNVNFLSTLTTTMSSLLAISCLSGCIWSSHRILSQSLSTLTLKYLVQTWYRCPCTLYQLLICDVPCRFDLQESSTLLVMCWIVSGASLHTLHLRSSLVWWILHFGSYLVLLSLFIYSKPVLVLQWSGCEYLVFVTHASHQTSTRHMAFCSPLRHIHFKCGKLLGNRLDYFPHCDRQLLMSCP